MWSPAVPWTRTSGGPVPVAKTPIGTPSGAEMWRGAMPSASSPRQPGSPAAAASSRIQVAVGMRASWAGQRPGLLGAEDLREHGRLGGAGRDDEPIRAAPITAGFIVTRSTCGSMWVGAGMAKHSPSTEGGRAREDREHVAVADHPEQHEVEDRPAVDGRRPVRAEGRGELCRAPVRAQPSPDRLAGGERVQVPSRERDLDCAAGRALLGPSIPSRMSSSGFTFESGWSR